MPRVTFFRFSDPFDTRSVGGSIFVQIWSDLSSNFTSPSVSKAVVWPLGTSLWIEVVAWLKVCSDSQPSIELDWIECAEV